MIAVVLIAMALSACTDARVVNSSSLTPESLAASWITSGKAPRAPSDLNSTSLQKALKDALSILSAESFHVGEFAKAPLDGARLPPVDNLDALTRLLKHIVECALDQYQTATLQTSKGSKLQFRGLLGLAPQWIRHSIDKDAQESVSGCLAARATIFKTPSISLRGYALGLYANETEEEVYSSLEGQFWGNIFDEEDAALLSCWSTNTALAWSQSRVCATGDPVGIGRLSCGIMSHLGPCKKICRGGPESDDPLSVRVCGDNYHVVAVYLRDEALA